MSIFSRLFNKNGDGDEKDPADEEASPDVKQEGNSRKPTAPATAATDGKAGTMRPAAPAFDITSTPAAAPSPSTEAAAPAVRPEGRPARHANVSARTLPYVTPDVAAAVDARVQAARSKGAVTTTRQGSQDPASPPARPRVAPPSPVAGAPVRTHPSKDGPKPPPVPPEPPKHHHDAGKRKEGPPDLPKGASHARPRQPTGGAVAAAAPLRAEPVAADPTSDVLTLEFASSPRQKAAPPVPAASVESAPSFDASFPAVVPATNIDAPGGSPASARIEAPSEPTDSDGMALLHDLDAAFGAMVGRRLTDRPVEAPPHLASVAEVRELFMALAANHMRQVRDFMIGLKWGEAPREAIVLCEAATQSLLRAAKEMELGDLCAGLEGYAKTLRQMSSAEDAVSHEALLSSYAKLAEQLPDVFALEGEQVQREAIIVHSLLQQVPEVRKVTIDKIYAAGLTGLDVLFDARPDEIAATTGISESLAALIVEKFKRYREDAKKLADVRHDAERKRLAELLTLLREVHGQYEVNASGWSEEAQAKKKELRQARNEVLLQIKVLLARLGEVGRLNELERLPFERKIDELDKFLRDSKVQPVHALV